MHRVIQKKICFIVIILLWVLTTVGCSGEKEIQEIALSEPEISKKEINKENESEKTEKGTIFLHVCGEVVNPGVYELPEGSRIFEAIKAAGGMKEEAAIQYLNQAAIAKDGQQIYVPSVKEVQSENEAEATQKPEEDGKVNLNTASKEELMTLSGIGEAKADAIIRYREEHGKFQNPEEVMEIEGIKEGVFNKIKDQIKI